jgi:hypothetical protein
MPKRWWLVVPATVLLPWAALAAAWWLSGRWWLGVLAMVAGGYLAFQILTTADKWLTDHGK